MKIAELDRELARTQGAKRRCHVGTIFHRDLFSLGRRLRQIFKKKQPELSSLPKQSVIVECQAGHFYTAKSKDEPCYVCRALVMGRALEKVG